MQQIFFYTASLLVCLFAQRATAQCNIVCPSGQTPTFKITYTYDGAGNRTKRSSVCLCVSSTMAAPSGNEPTQRLAQNGTPENASAAGAPLSGDLEGDKVGQASITAVSPNPTSSLLNITFNQTLAAATLIISDATGKVAAEYKVSGSTYSLDMSALPSGAYYCTLRTQDNIDTQKIIKID